MVEVPREVLAVASNKHTSFPKTFASGDANEWFEQFEICCRANEWSDDTKSLKLPTLLGEEALALWLKLSEDEQKNKQDS